MTTTAASSFAAALCGVLLAAAAPAAARRELGDSCTSASECSTAFAECLYSRCACNASFVEVNKKCFLPVGGVCNQILKCDAVNSECINGRCVCSNQYLQAENNTYCYKPPDFGELCEKDFDCAGLSDLGRCERHRCRCSAASALDGARCKRKIDELGARCLKETEVCYLEKDGDKQNVECKDNKCTCKEGATPSKDNLSCGAGALEVVSVVVSLMTVMLAKVLA